MSSTSPIFVPLTPENNEDSEGADVSLVRLALGTFSTWTGGVFCVVAWGSQTLLCERSETKCLSSLFFSCNGHTGAHFEPRSTTVFLDACYLDCRMAAQKF